MARWAGAVTDRQHEIAQRQEAHGERANADDRDLADRPSVDDAGRSAHCDRNAVNRGKKCERRHCCGADLNGSLRNVRQHSMHNVASEADRRRTPILPRASVRPAER
jgi:hypothetical protein